MADTVNVSLSYDNSKLTFPINPERLKQTIDSPSISENVVGIGEVSIPQTPSLMVISFSSFFWGDRDNNKPDEYVKWINRWQRSKKPARFVVSKFNWNILVTCESFAPWVTANEEDDIYFEITLKEYREYKAKRIHLVTDSQNLSKYENFLPWGDYEEAVEVLMQNPRPTRNNVNKEAIPTILETRDDDTISSISKRLSNDTSNWKDLYDSNKSVLGEIATCDAISANIPIEIPSSFNPTKIAKVVNSVKKGVEKTKLISSIFNKIKELVKVMNTLKNIIDSIPEALEPYKTFMGKVNDLMNIFSPDNCLGPLDSISHALDDLMDIAEMPEEAINSFMQMKDTIGGLVEDINSFMGG